MGRMEDIKSDELMNTLMGLFEKKLAWSMQNQDRVQSLAETAERNKTDLEYARLNQLMKSDADKQAFEERKMVSGYKNGLDLETMKQKGLMDIAVLNNASDMTKAKWVKDASIYGHDAASTAEALKASHSVVKEADGTTRSTFDPRAYDSIQAKLKAGGGSAAQVKNAIDVTRGYMAAEDAPAAKAYYDSLDKKTQDAVGSMFGLTPSTPPAAVVPTTPKTPSLVPKPAPAVVPIAPVSSVVPQPVPGVIAKLTPAEEAAEIERQRFTA